ncbi:HNH endonuclease signature motif containing protein [Microbacterium sp. CIAB417]|uniref:HNH endonuclease signature motif containing protein n=1 Tax=Microbacterium sp. CIAB417 TaxID=2860287 RepID=UPI001FAE34CF|nr:HNH endonuclease signature motif containing protein [Microbacterium sp. CIAB417]
MTTTHLEALHAAVSRLDAVWTDAEDAAGLDRAALIAANETLGTLNRVVTALQAEVAAGIAHESRAELGSESLAKQHGFRTAARLVAAVTGASAGDASRLVAVGAATAPRSDLLGAPLPAKYPAVQRALTDGSVSVAAAALIIALLDRVRLKIDSDRVQQAEALLVEKAPGLSLDEVRRLVTRAEAFLDPDGVAPREESARAQNSLTFYERDGRLRLDGDFDIESGAPIKAALEGYVTAVFAARAKTLDPNAPDADRRTIRQLQADALSSLCAHALGCDDDAPALAGATVIVRVNLDDLTTGTGYGTIDGIDQPISIGAIRRMAANGGIIPTVLNTDSDILDWGREKRLFTRTQRLALTERDGGCAMCTLPPSMTRAHHINWWNRDHGTTDLNNGILLCDNCHHRIHDNDWTIHIDGTSTTAHVWFIPPPHIDPTRTPRLGGTARYTLAA